MIRVITGNNVDRTPVNVSPESTLRQALEAGGVDVSGGGTLQLDGATLQPGDLNKTFAELGYDGSNGHDSCSLLKIAKLDNAQA